MCVLCVIFIFSLANFGYLVISLSSYLFENSVLCYCVIWYILFFALFLCPVAGSFVLCTVTVLCFCHLFSVSVLYLFVFVVHTSVSFERYC